MAPPNGDIIDEISLNFEAWVKINKNAFKTTIQVIWGEISDVENDDDGHEYVRTHLRHQVAKALRTFIQRAKIIETTPGIMS